MNAGPKIYFETGILARLVYRGLRPGTYTRNP